MTSDGYEVFPVWNLTREEWLGLRRELGLGGSDAGTIMGVNNYNSPYALYCEKMGLSEDDDDAGEAAEWGNLLEPVIAAKYARDYNVAVVEWPVIIRSNKYPFMFANIDYLEVVPSEDFPAGVVTVWRETYMPPGVIGIIECKTGGIASPGSVYLWDNNGIPESYYWQGVHYSIVLDLLTVTFAALLGGKGLVVRDMPIDDDDREMLIASESAFYDLLVAGTPPEPDGSKATESAQKSRFRNTESALVYDGGSKLQTLCIMHQNAKAEAEEWDSKRKQLRAEILEMIGNAEVGVDGDEKLFTFKAGKEVESVDAAALREKFPDVYQAVKKTRPGARVLRFTKT